MIDLFRLASEVQDICVANGWQFCFIGGIALQRYGEPRVTQDVDLTLLTGFADETRYIDILMQYFPVRVADAHQFALRNRVLLLKSKSGIGVDVALGGLPFEESLVARATPFEFLPGVTLQTCSAEDLIVLKAFADRARDWSDIEGILLRQSVLDWDYIQRQLAPLVEIKEAPHILQRLRDLRSAK